MKKQIDAVALFRNTMSHDQLQAAFRAYLSLPVHQRNKAMQDAIAPAMDKINAYMGQENNVSYMAYLLEYVFNERGEL